MKLDWAANVSSTYQPLTQITGNSFIAGFLQIALIGVVTLCLIFLLIGGVRWITSKGEKEGVAKAQKTISGAIIGLIIALAIFLILGLLGAFTKLDLLHICIPGVSGQCASGLAGNPASGPPPGPVGSCGCGVGAAGQCALVGTISNDAGSCWECTSTQWIPRNDISYSSCNTPVSCYTCP